MTKAKAETEAELPHLYGRKFYTWARRFHDSTNRVNLLSAANQISKSSTMIRRCISNATDPARWKLMWGKGVKPGMFWYFYPDSMTLEKEWLTKWSEWLPKGKMEFDSQYGWKADKNKNMINYVRFNTGVHVFFQLYTKKVTNVQAGSVHEVYCFTKGTKIWTQEGQKDISEIKQNQLVLSARGWEPVTRVYEHQVDETYEVRFSDGTKLRGTGTHPLWTHRGWVSLSSLHHGDVCFKVPLWVNALHLTTLSYLTVDFLRGSTDIKTVGKRITGEVRRLVSLCTLFCGRKTPVKKFLKEALYITRILILSTILSPTLFVSLGLSIQEYIKRLSGKKRENGSAAARNAELSLRHDLLRILSGIVHSNVVANMWKETAPNAQPILVQGLSQNSVSVLHSVPIKESISVYNLEVSGSHTFFANDILTHNCDEELPLPFYDELMFRMVRTNGIFNSAFTPTLNQLFWKQALESEKILPTALKMQVSMYDCLKYEDGSPGAFTEEGIKEVIGKCKNETEVQRRVFGKFVTEEGRTYYAFEYERNMVPRYQIAHWHIYGGVDYGSGGSGHPAGILFVAVRPDYKKAAVFRGWRGDNIETTAGDVFNKFLDLRGGLTVTQQVYDPASKDFGTIAERNGVTFTKADKSRDLGEHIVNTLFKHEMLDIFEDDPELLKLASELLHMMQDNQKSSNKAGDDLADTLRYICTMIPWDFEAINEQIKAKELAEKGPPPPLTEAQLQEIQIRERRGIYDNRPEESTGWSELDAEFDHWNAEYGEN